MSQSVHDLPAYSPSGHNQSRAPWVRTRENAQRGAWVLCALCALFLVSLCGGRPASAQEAGTPTPVMPLPALTIIVPPTPATVPDTPTPQPAPAINTATPAGAATPTEAAPPIPIATITITRLPAGAATNTPATAPSHTPAAGAINAYPTVALPTATTQAIPTAAPARAVPTALPPEPETPTPTVSLTATPTPSKPTPTSTSTWYPPGPECAPKPGPAVLKLDVPYIQQVTDIPGADGNWACGPSSVAMVLAYFGKLDPWQDYVAAQATRQPALPKSRPADQARLVKAPVLTPTAAKAASKSSFAPYVTNEYSNNGHTYSAVALDPRGNRVAGLYGTIVPSGLADWGRMAAVIQWHGLASRQISTSWDSIVAALKRGHPVIVGNSLTSVGHILVVIGYTNNGHVIVNDPYGDRFSPGYGSTSGKGLFYRWSCLTARNALEVIGTYQPPKTPTATATQVPTPVDTPTPTAPASDQGSGARDQGSAVPSAAEQGGANMSSGSYVIEWVSTPSTLAGANGARVTTPGSKGRQGPPLLDAGLAGVATIAPAPGAGVAAVWWGVLMVLAALSLVLISLGLWMKRTRKT